jgi:hypothetical protein
MIKIPKIRPMSMRFGYLDIGNQNLFGPALAGLRFGYWNLTY